MSASPKLEHALKTLDETFALLRGVWRLNGPLDANGPRFEGTQLGVHGATCLEIIRTELDDAKALNAAKDEIILGACEDVKRLGEQVQALTTDRDAARAEAGALRETLAKTTKHP